MPEGFSILAELTSAVIGAITGMLAEHGKSSVMQKIGKEALIRKIRTREKYLKKKYEKSFEALKKLDGGSFYEWLKERRTISRILSFSNAEDTGNINIEQMRHSRECFFTDAFHMAQARDFNEKEELRKVLNDLFLYVDELFWGSLDEKDVFLYKKSVGEIRKLINENTGKIIQAVQYHDSFAEYIDNQKTEQKVPFKLDYRSEEIPFVGREKEFGEIDAFCASAKQISWWAVIGKGGSGKSRLAYEYIKSNMSSAEWKMCFLREEFFSQAGGGGKYRMWNTWTYDKNLLLVVDYVQKYAKEVAQWIEGLFNSNSVTRKIRILLLERTDGEQSLWMRDGFEKTVAGALKYDRDFLRLQSLDMDLILFAVKYAEKKGRQISEADAADAWEKLKSIDADTRILYFIMILEAIFDNEPWRNWNRNDLAGYIVRREQEDIEIRFKHDKDMVRSFNRVLAFCTATKELPVFEVPENLPEMIKEEIEVIKNNSCDKHELCAGMQLENGVLQPVTPDIIGEYMVLYIIDQYYFDKGEKSQFIRDLWAYDSGDFHFFVYRLFEDKMDDGAYEDITKLMLFDAVPYGNICVMENYSNLLWRMAELSDLEQAFTLANILRNVYHNHPLNRMITCSYANILFNLSCKQELPEVKSTVEELGRLSIENGENGNIQTIYACVLSNLSMRNNQELTEIEAMVEELRRLAAENIGNEDILTAYTKGLVHLSCNQELPELKATVGELRRLFAENEGNGDIQRRYAKGLYNLSVKQELTEVKSTLEELRRLAVENKRNGDILTRYAEGLYSLSLKQELPEAKSTLEELSRLVGENEGNRDVLIAYANGLVSLSCKQELAEQKSAVEELRSLAAENEGNGEIQTAYAYGLHNLSNNQELLERKVTVGELRSLAAENEGNGDIQKAYAWGLYNLSNNQELLERKATVEEMRSLAAENEGNEDVQTAYVWGLYNLSNNQELLERKAAVEEMRSLAAENEGNEDIQKVYAYSLYNLSNNQELLERKATVGELRSLAAENEGNEEIQMAYAYGLFNLSLKQKLAARKVMIEELGRLAGENEENVDVQKDYERGLYLLCFKQEPTEMEETIEELRKLTARNVENVII